MKCSKCNTKNIIKALYCKKCGNKFTKEEQEKAYSKTIFGKYELYKKWKKRFNLGFITGSNYFKAFILLVIIGFGVYYWYINGINTKILESDYYEIYYSEELDEYYLVVDDDTTEVGLNLYFPNRLEDIEINHYSTDDVLIKEIDKNKDDEIVLETYNNDYYVITSKYTGDKEEDLKIFVYNKDKITLEKNDV